MSGDDWTEAQLLAAVGRILTTFDDTEVVKGERMGTHAVTAATRGVNVFPLDGKAPLFPQRHPKGSHERAHCKGACGQDGHGFYDATTNVNRVARWWAVHPNANIGAAVPLGVVVIDIDPRNGGLDTLHALERRHGRMPVTLTSWSGRGDGGRHLWFRHPGGKLRVPRDWPGIDLKLGGAGYVVFPPSIHPDTGKPYGWDDPEALSAQMPAWLVDALRPDVITPPPRRHNPFAELGDSIADWYCEAHTWWDVLAPHGWQAINHDGTEWLHPAATSELSATVTNDCLFVYTPNTPFEQTLPGEPHGYTKFRAYGLLNHSGDLSAAAKAARELRDGPRP